MPSSVQRAKLLSQFSCLGERCEDTCCYGWSMQVDDATLARYRDEKPELLSSVEEEAPGLPWIMRKDKQSGYCVKFEQGLCGIHKEHGERFLGDACHFFPRVTRRLGDHVMMTATISCPEIARLFFSAENGVAFEAATVDRLPQTVKDYLPAELSSEEALSVHQAFLAAVHDTAVSPEHILARIYSASQSLALINKKDWPRAVSFYLSHADMRLPEPETDPADPFNLLLALAGLIVASHKKITSRLQETISEMEKALAAKIDWQKMQIDTDAKSIAAYRELCHWWKKEGASRYDAVLRRWIEAQLSLTLHPFAGIGENISDRVVIMCVRFATFKLALMSASAIKGNALPNDTVVRIAQSLARLLDHLGDAAFSLQIYAETGWSREARLRGIVNI